MDVIKGLSKYLSQRLFSCLGVSLVELSLFLALLVASSAAAFFFAFHVSNEKEELGRENIALGAFLSGASGATTYMRATGEFDAKTGEELATTLSMNAAIANDTTGEGRFASALLEMESGSCDPGAVSFIVRDNRDASFRDLGENIPNSAIKKVKRRFVSSNCERRLRFFDVLYRLPKKAQTSLEMSAVKEAKYEYFQPISGYEETEGTNSSEIISGSSSSVITGSSSSSAQSFSSESSFSSSETSSSEESTSSEGNDDGGSGGNSGGGGGGGGGGCFIEGTPILLSSGLEVSIENIRVGDEVVSLDIESGEYRVGTVTRTLIHRASSYTVLNGHIGVTPNHRVYSQGRWKPVGSLRPGKKLTSPWASRTTISSLDKIDAPVTVYNFEVFPYRNYIAGGLVVHNARKDNDQALTADFINNDGTNTQ